MAVENIETYDNEKLNVFIEILKQYNLTVDQFLDIKEMWESFPSKYKCKLLEQSVQT